MVVLQPSFNSEGFISVQYMIFKKSFRSLPDLRTNLSNEQPNNAMQFVKTVAKMEKKGFRKLPHTVIPQDLRENVVSRYYKSKALELNNHKM